MNGTERNESGAGALRILDLCSGLNGWTAPARAAGLACFGVDSDPRLPAEMTADVRQLQGSEILERFGRPDLILASPPCETFSVASIGHHWHKDPVTGSIGAPKTPEAVVGLQVLRNVLELCEELAPRLGWILENPRGGMRKVLPESLRIGTVWQCRYGSTSAKPTDIFGRAPWLKLRPECHNGATDHESAPRGAKTGTQGVGARDGFTAANWRSVIPYGLAESVIDQAVAEARRDESQ